MKIIFSFCNGLGVKKLLVDLEYIKSWNYKNSEKNILYWDDEYIIFFVCIKL